VLANIEPRSAAYVIARALRRNQGTSSTSKREEQNRFASGIDVGSLKPGHAEQVERKWKGANRIFAR
jgi:hypothetical protein